MTYIPGIPVSETNSLPVLGTGLYTSGAITALTTGQVGVLAVDVSRNLRALATVNSAAGADGVTNTAIGFGQTASQGTATNNLFAMAQYLFNGTSWDRQKKPNSGSRLLSSAATTNATSVKATAGDLFKVSGNNTVASKRYLKLYNKATAPNVGTDTPVLTFVLPASAPFAIDLAANGQYFSAGIAYAITGAAADADTTAIAAGDIECLNLTYA